MSDYKKLLKKIHNDLEGYQDKYFDESSLEGIFISLEEISFDLMDKSSKEEDELYSECESLVFKAQRFFEDQNAEEQRNQVRDEKSYEGSRHYN